MPLLFTFAAGTAAGGFADAIYDFAEGPTQPFVIGSAGLLSSQTTHTFSPSGGPAMTFRSQDHNFAWGGGAGVKVFVTPRLLLRPQVRIVFSEATGVSAGWHGVGDDRAELESRAWEN